MINKKPSLPTLESWLQNTEACAGAVEWIAENKSRYKPCTGQGGFN